MKRGQHALLLYVYKYPFFVRLVPVQRRTDRSVPYIRSREHVTIEYRFTVSSMYARTR